MVSGFASERRPASPGTASGIASEYPSGFNRISHYPLCSETKNKRLTVFVFRGRCSDSLARSTAFSPVGSTLAEKSRRLADS